MAESVFTPEQEARINALLIEYLEQNGASIDAGINVVELTGDALTDENLKKLTIPSILPNTNQWAYTSLQHMMAPIQHAITQLQTQDTQVQTALSNATSATTAANSGAQAANTAASAANTAATGAESVNATLAGTIFTVTNRNGQSTSVNVSFDIYRTYPSVAAMNADAVNVSEGRFVMIATTDPTSADNAKMYVRNGASAAEAFSFICDLDQASSEAWADWLNNMKPVIQQAINNANTAASSANSAASNANTKGSYAQTQGDYAKEWNDHPPYIADGTTEHRGDPYYMYLWDINTHAYVRGAYVKGADLDYNTMTPEEYLLDDFELPQDYDVDDWGTEEILLGENGCAPVLDLKYGINAGDTIKNLPHNYVSAVGEQSFTDAQKARARKNIGVIEQEQLDALTRHTRKTDFDLDVLKQAVADQNLEKYGLKVGDQKTINGHTYVIAGLNCMKGSNSYTCTTDHVGLIVIPHTTQAWNASGDTSQGADNRGAGYMYSDLHYYLKNALLPLVNTDLGADNLLGHTKVLSNCVIDNKSSSWGLESNCKICALSEVQVYGSVVWGKSPFDIGEACQQLDVFQHFKYSEIFNENIWLRDIVLQTHAALANYSGEASNSTASSEESVAALVMFH